MARGGKLIEQVEGCLRKAVVAEDADTGRDVRGTPYATGQRMPEPRRLRSKWVEQNHVSDDARGTSLHPKKWGLAYVNLKGRKQTRVLRNWEREIGANRQIFTIAPTQLNQTMACTLIEGCDQQKAKEIAQAMIASVRSKSETGE